MIKKKIAATVMAVAILAGSTAIPAFANTDPAAEQASYTATTETNEQENQEAEIVRDETAPAASDQSEEENAEPENNPRSRPPAT